MNNLSVGDQTQDQEHDYHPIMINGQPALFIPATSAMSSTLFSQMMMSSSGNNQLDSLTSIENTAQNIQSTFQSHQANTNMYNNSTNSMSLNAIGLNQVFSDPNSCNGLSFVNVGEAGNNVISNLENLNQNQIILNNNQLASDTNGQQQVICIQPDGNSIGNIYIKFS